MSLCLQMKYNAIPLRHFGVCVCVLAIEIRYPTKANTALETVCALTSETRYSTKTSVSSGFNMCVRGFVCVSTSKQNKTHFKDNTDTWNWCWCVSGLTPREPC